jgi:hypothetical protein
MKKVRNKLYRTINLSVILNGYETSLLSLWEEHRKGVLNIVIWKIFGPNMEEVAEGWRNLHNEDHFNLHAS